MIEKIWNPQTTSQKLVSRFFIPVGCRDNATRNQRAILALGVIVTGLAMYVQKQQMKQLQERLDNSIEIPKLKLPTFSFSTREA